MFYQSNSAIYEMRKDDCALDSKTLLFYYYKMRRP